MYDSESDSESDETIVQINKVHCLGTPIRLNKAHCPWNTWITFSEYSHNVLKTLVPIPVTGRATHLNTLPHQIQRHRGAGIDKLSGRGEHTSQDTVDGRVLSGGPTKATTGRLVQCGKRGQK